MQIPRPHQGFFELMRKLHSRELSSLRPALLPWPDTQLFRALAKLLFSLTPSFPSKRAFHPKTASQGTHPSWLHTPIPLPYTETPLRHSKGTGMLSMQDCHFFGKSSSTRTCPSPQPHLHPPSSSSCMDTIKPHYWAVQIKRNNPSTYDTGWWPSAKCWLLKTVHPPDLILNFMGSTTEPDYQKW